MCQYRLSTDQYSNWKPIRQVRIVVGGICHRESDLDEVLKRLQVLEACVANFEQQTIPRPQQREKLSTTKELAISVLPMTMIKAEWETGIK